MPIAYWISPTASKSGGNTLHGSVFGFHRETNFNATSHSQTSKMPLPINNFGATLGGPIINDKIFLFGSYGGVRQVAPVTFETVVPDALQRVGNFSENLPTTTAATGLGAYATAINAADCDPDRRETPLVIGQRREVRARESTRLGYRNEDFAESTEIK